MVSVGLVLLIAGFLVAQSKETDRRFEVVGKDGTTVVVTGHLTYGAYGGYAHDVDGLMVKEGSGETTVPWARLKTVNIIDTGKLDGILHVMAVELIFSDPKTTSRTLPLVPGNLRGKTELGEYNAGLSDLKSITPIEH